MANKWGKMKRVAEFIFLGSRITPDGGCRHKIKRCLLLGRKAMTNLDSILKRRDFILPTKVNIVNTVFSRSHVGMWELDIKKGEHWRINALELWCWRRLLRVLWTARRLNQSILKKSTLTIHWKECCWGSKYFGNLRRANSVEKTLMLERLKDKGEKGGRGWDG